jgi:hypothetical protein
MDDVMSTVDPTELEDNPAAPDVDPPDVQPATEDGERTSPRQAELNRRDAPPV